MPDAAPTCEPDAVIVAIDVIRATTTAITGLSLGRQCLLVDSLDSAQRLALSLDHPLLAGELEGIMPQGFDLNNSPADLASRTDITRPMILLSTSGTRLICKYSQTHRVYVACLRNYSAQTAYLAREHRNIVLMGAGSRGEFRREDILCCALIARGLLQSGYRPLNQKTAEIIEQWSEMPVAEIAGGKSARYLLESGQEHDLEYILTHIDDLSQVYHFVENQVLALA